MNLEKIWVNKQAKEDNFIVFDNQLIYRLKVKEIEFLKIQNELNHGKINEQFVGLPISYLRKVEYREDDKELKFFYHQDSEDCITIGDKDIRKDIFDFLKSNTPVKKVEQKKSNFFSRTRKPLIALLIISAIFIYVLCIITEMNKGFEYELQSSPGIPIGALILGLANLGLIDNIAIFLHLY